MANNSEILQKLKAHLRELFQFDSSDLDFGIYRIMNFKRKEIENFIEQDVIKEVEKEFEKYKTQSNKELTEKIQKVENKIKEDFGSDILHNGKLIEKYGETKIVKEYLELKKQVEEIELNESIQAQVFNDLYDFFSRYYEDGDFISKKRYSGKQHKYAIPYSGEEVKLYWANYDQYYVKTGEIFKDYEFNKKGYRFIFRTSTVDVPAGNVKGDRRYFVLQEDEPVRTENKTCTINFEYRPLTDSDLKKYPVETKGGKAKETRIKQDELNPILKDKILSVIKSIELKAILSETQDDKTLLEKHLLKFTRKITSDFFIHKDLKGFLERELDYFIKTEVLDVESFDTEKEKYFDRHLTRAKVVRNIGKRIIEFLSQIEDFQKYLWEKKKFVLRTEYAITLDRIPEEFHNEILENKEQLKEWEKLGFGEIKTAKDLKDKKLPVDTKYFTQEFKEKLLEKLSEKESIDDLLDGVLIKSENWQALNLLLEKYKEKVQTIYIDPPFNTGEDFLYKDKYQNSTCLTLINERLEFVRKILLSRGSFYLHLDENANYFGRMLLGKLGFDNIQEISFNTNATKDEEADLYGYKSFGNRYVLKHSTIYYCLNNDAFFIKLWKPNRNSTNLEIGWLDLISFPKKEKPKKIEDFNYFIEKYDGKGNLVLKKVDINEKIYPLGDLWYDIYSFTQSEMRTSENVSFLTQKPENLIRRIIQTSTKQNDFVLDYFAGSGTTVSVAHKLKRKWVGVEMGDNFHEFYYEVNNKKSTIKLGILGRLKNVLKGDRKFSAVDKKRRSHLSKDINWQGGGFFKYQYLEQYEDTLHNIDFPQEERAKTLFNHLSEEGKTEYLLKYMLKFETEGSPSLLDIKQFENPFEYKLKIISSGKGEEIVDVDLVEIFNYLIGLKVNKYRFLQENGRKYVFVLGERNNRKTAIVWRATKGIDLAKDKEIIDGVLNGYKPDEIYINGDSFVKDAKILESEFKALMGV